ncbi:conserved hypothetical protein [Nitrosococcus halophilus Nc 4]|uniref:Uncharacterized protein n=1 Tax=Nitrosococcus halophilus (strain Nc4) TaxID=472759 RepID=D5C3Y3_NITHN|nr:hypothetical protein [Nitrosococcus halophilus]ADE16920.1 conserved hypothetical protein [Nitrosococcus halophilus Nc 4]
MEPLAKLLAVIGAITAMITGLFLIFSRLKAKGQSFGPSSLRAIGIVLFVPTLLILAIVTEFNTEALAALFGTLVGYFLAHSGSSTNQ